MFAAETQADGMPGSARIARDLADRFRPWGAQVVQPVAYTRLVPAAGLARRGHVLYDFIYGF